MILKEEVIHHDHLDSTCPTCGKVAENKDCDECTKWLLKEE